MSEIASAGPNDARRTAFAPVLAAGHVFRLLPTGAAAFEAMLQHIERAQHSVVLEFYICRPGAVSRRFRNALVAACMRGVRVQLLLDAFGSGEVAGTYWRELEQCGGQLRGFNPLRLLRLTFRNHRKLLVTDGDGVSHGWRDLALELRGPTVDALTGSFARMWTLAAFTPTSLRAFAGARPTPDSEASRPALLLAGPGCRSGDLREYLYADLRAASRVTVHAAYFLPSHELGRILADVALRGEVRILMPGSSDVPIAQLATWHAIRRMGGTAIRFFEYLPQMMHGKLLVIDDVVYFGSANLDVRSRLINYELMLRLPVSALAQQARGIFEADLQHSRAAGIATSSWWLRAQQRAAYWLLARVDPYLASRKLRMLQ